jgi:hypothetical protein
VKIAAVLVGVMLLSGCGLTYVTMEPLPAETTVPVARSSAPGSVLVGPVVIPGVSDATDKYSANVDCSSGVLRLTTATGEYTAVALKPGCTATTDTPQNGDHGFYPKPPATAKTEQVQTPVGAATLFTNQYSECTNSCYIGGDEVALLLVDGAVVQIMAVTSPASGTKSRSRTDLVQLLQTLRHA